MIVFRGSNERSHHVESGKINPNFQKWKLFEIWYIKKISEIWGATKLNNIKKNGTFRPFSPYKKAYIPNYALKSSSKCSARSPHSSGVSNVRNEVSTGSLKICKRPASPLRMSGHALCHRQPMRSFLWAKTLLKLLSSISWIQRCIGRLGKYWKIIKMNELFLVNLLLITRVDLIYSWNGQKGGVLANIWASIQNIS